MDISGIIADNAHAKDSGVSFGEHFGERSPNIEELSLMNRTPNLSAHSARAPSVQRGLFYFTFTVMNFIFIY